ncbi:MAG TPA: Na+/H+ antiporter NhaA [Casimicrobiaceae bacterium]|nr:Na+/H+ antiporter NhaA [Casimicrobiaceae bacterium]
MSDTTTAHRLDRPVDPRRDHVLGPARADLTLVEYGSYACPYCRVANDEVAKLRDRYGERMRYVFRQRPITGSDLARRAAALAETAPDEATFWSAHVELMTRSQALTEEDLTAVAAKFGLAADAAARERASERVDEDTASARASGVRVTPTFFINGRRYDGTWDVVSLSEAMLGSLGHRVQSAAVDFASWAPATGVLLLLMSIIAVLAVNSPLHDAFLALWQMPFGFTLGGHGFRMPVVEWIDDGLLTIFFLVVGLEIKREFTVGRLSSRRLAAFPIAAAIGGMLVPAAVYLALIPQGPWQHGWGVPMTTDTAFAVALIVMLGRRVPVELRVFLTAAAIVDDLGSIAVVALFYSNGLDVAYLALAVALVGVLVVLNRTGVYRALPYAAVGVALWGAVHASGLHATLSGVVLAMLIPTRPPPNLKVLQAQAATIFDAETSRGSDVLRHGPALPTLQAIDAIHDRLESPAARTLRAIEPWSSFAVLPLFALANAGVELGGDVLGGREPLALSIGLGLLVGKPLGILAGCALAAATRVAVKPDAYTWRQLGGAAALAGIGFTMSLFIAGVSFPDAADFAAAKVAVFAGSLCAAACGVALLWRPRSGPRDEHPFGASDAAHAGTPV